MFYLMGYKLSIKKSLVFLFVFLETVVGFAQNDIVMDSCNQDLRVKIYAKTVWTMTVEFIQKSENGYVIMGSYYFRASRKIDTVLVRRIAMENDCVSDDIMKYSYSSTDLKQMSNRSVAFRKIFNTISPSFFELSNYEKMLKIEEYLSDYKVYDSEECNE